MSKRKTADVLVFPGEGIRRIDEHDEAVVITRQEGKRLSMSIAQVKEVLRLHYMHLAKVFAVDPVAVIGSIMAHAHPRKGKP